MPRKPHVYTASDLAGKTGFDERLLSRRLDSARLDLSSIRHIHNVGYLGTTPGGQQKLLYIIQTPSGRTCYFGTKREIERDAHFRNRRQPTESDFPEDVEIIIPGKRDYKAEYQRRVQQAMARGYSKSQAVGHPKPGEPGIGRRQKGK